MNRFEYYEPATLHDAVRLLVRCGPAASVLAGGTDLLVEIKEKLRRPGHIINIKRIPDIDALVYDPLHGLRIGALATARAVELHPAVLRHYPGLAQAAKELGSIQVRNRATIAGNVCRASPSADTLPPLVADGAQVILVGPAAQDGAYSERTVALEAFFTGPGRSVMRPGEILREITIAAPAPRTGRAYIKHGRRKAMELATVGVAASLTLDRGLCSNVRIALGAVAPTPIRARRAEAVLEGRAPDAATLAAVARAAMAEATPISNVRASAAYRREMVGVLTRRAIEQALEQAR